MSTTLECSVEEAVKHARTPRLLHFVANPLVQFTAVDPPDFPETWSAGTYRVQLRIFGLVPLGRQAVVLSFPVVKNSFALRDNGHSRLIARWDHLITITAAEHGAYYEDRVSVSAGALTPFVWAFAWVFYRHRQRRWRLLASHRFDYGNA
jgi:hypothetical protein